MSDIFLHIAGQQTGPYQLAQVRQLLAEGKVTLETPAWSEGMSEWSTVAAILGPLPTGGTPPPFVPPIVSAPVQAKKGMSGWVIAAIVVGCCFFLIGPCACLAGIALGPITNGIKKAKENIAMQQTRMIALSMYSYAADHSGTYPDGKTSTEIFQKLIDGGYVSDPGVFYISDIPGKMKATTHHLTADNVCFDATSGVTDDSSNMVPVVFSTGYTVTYSPGAIPILDANASTPFPGIAVAYKSNMAQFLNAPSSSSSVMRPLSQFVPLAFNAGTNSYRQLKP